MGWQASFTRFATWNPSGVTVLNVSSVKNTVHAADLPCLFAIPAMSPPVDVQMPIGFDQGQLRSTIHVEIYYLQSAGGHGLDAAENWAALMTGFDNLLAELAADPTLNDELAEGMKIVRQRFNPEWANVPYMGVYWLAEWTREIDV